MVIVVKPTFVGFLHTFLLIQLQTCSIFAQYLKGGQQTKHQFFLPETLLVTYRQEDEQYTCHENKLSILVIQPLTYLHFTLIDVYIIVTHSFFFLFFF